MLLKPLLLIALAAGAIAGYSDPCNHPKGTGQ